MDDLQKIIDYDHSEDWSYNPVWTEHILSPRTNMATTSKTMLVQYILQGECPQPQHIRVIDSHRHL